MISDDKYRGYKSIKCACGKKTALLERPSAYNNLKVADSSI